MDWKNPFGTDTSAATAPTPAAPAASTVESLLVELAGEIEVADGDEFEQIDPWDQIDDHARVWLNRPRPHAPCFFCRRWVGHSGTCYLLNETPILRFGKYEGKMVSEVPEDYLRWLVDNDVKMPFDIREAVDRLLANIDRTAPLERLAHPARRESGPSGKTDSRIAPGCEPTATLDTLDVDGKRPTESTLGASVRCENR